MLVPSEDVVNVWLQEVEGFFTKTNINVPQKKEGRISKKGIKIWGGKGKEIDILGYRVEDKKKVWVEISVSPNPYKATAGEAVNKALKHALSKFPKDKDAYVKGVFNSKKYEKWWVYSNKLFAKKKRNEEEKFRKRLESRKIKPIEFTSILKEVIDQMEYTSNESTRMFLRYFKSFGKEIFREKTRN